MCYKVYKLSRSIAIGNLNWRQHVSYILYCLIVLISMHDYMGIGRVSAACCTIPRSGSSQIILLFDSVK